MTDFADNPNPVLKERHGIPAVNGTATPPPFYLQLDSLQQRVEQNLHEAITELAKKLDPFVIERDQPTAEPRPPHNGSPVTIRIQRVDDSVTDAVERIYLILRSIDI